MKLGRLGGPSTLHGLKLATFIDHSKIQAPPLALDLGGPNLLPIWGNDRLGDCTCTTWAGVFAQDAWTHGEDVSFATGEVETMYRASGWDGTDATDRGWTLAAAAQYAQTSGLRDTLGNLHVADGWLSVRHADHTEVQIALCMMGALPVGVQLPLAAQHQVVWDTDGGAGDQTPNSWGGHSLTLIGYDRTGGWFRTWGKRQRFTWAWWNRYVDEVIGKIDALWASGDRPAPGGFLLEDARLALGELRA